MASKIEIANLALNHLGMGAITSTTDNHPSATAFNTFYELCKDDVLSEHKWPFATVKGILSQVSNEVPRYVYVYGYPFQAAAVWSVFNSETLDEVGQEEFEVVLIPSINRRVICSNLELAYAEYTYKVEDTTLFSPKFSMVLSYRLAASMAHQLTGDKSVGLKLMDIYILMLHEAKRLSFGEKRKKPILRSSYRDARG